MKFAYITTAKRVEERWAQRHVSGTGPDARFVRFSVGWFVVTPDNLAFALGSEKPDLKEGDLIRLTLEKEQSNAK